MKRRLVLLLFLAALIQIRMSCLNPHLVKFATNCRVEVSPNPIQMTSDTLAFDVLIDAQNFKAPKGQTVVIQLHARGPAGDEEVGQIDLSSARIVKKTFLKMLTLKSKITRLELTAHFYKSGRPRAAYPSLDIAIIDDQR